MCVCVCFFLLYFIITIIFQWSNSNICSLIRIINDTTETHESREFNIYHVYQIRGNFSITTTTHTHRHTCSVCILRSYVNAMKQEKLMILCDFKSQLHKLWRRRWSLKRAFSCKSNFFEMLIVSWVLLANPKNFLFHSFHFISFNLFECEFR